MSDGAYIDVTKAARSDLRRLRRSREFPRILRALDALGEVPHAANLDIKPLEGHHPWCRLRVGVHRIIFRTLTPDEMAEQPAAEIGYAVARIVHRSEFDETVPRLP